MVTALLFSRNFAGDGGTTGHFWSLSLEEQFYVVWPCLLFLSGRSKAIWVACIASAGVAVFRFFHWANYNNNIISGRPQVRADALLVGCALALVLTTPRGRLILARWSEILALPAAVILLYCVVNYRWLTPLMESLSIAILIAAAVLYPDSLYSRALAFRPLTWLGVVSYSAYVWQGLFVGFHNSVAMWVLFPATAVISHYLIERPFIRIGYRLSARDEQRLVAPTASLAG